MFISAYTRLGDALDNENLGAVEVRTLQADSISVSLLKKSLRLHQPLPKGVCRLSKPWTTATKACQQGVSNWTRMLASKETFSMC